MIDGQSYPVLDPALWSFWLPWFLVVIGLELVFTGALYLRGRWTWPFAVVNALLAAASAIPAIWLLQTGQFWNPAAVDALTGLGVGGAIGTISAIIAISVAVIAGWDAVDGFLKAGAQREIVRERRPPDRRDGGSRATPAPNVVASRQRPHARGDAPCAIAWPPRTESGCRGPVRRDTGTNGRPTGGRLERQRIHPSNRTDPDERGAP